MKKLIIALLLGLSLIATTASAEPFATGELGEQTYMYDCGSDALPVMVDDLLFHYFDDLWGERLAKRAMADYQKTKTLLSRDVFHTLITSDEMAEGLRPGLQTVISILNECTPDDEMNPQMQIEIINLAGLFVEYSCNRYLDDVYATYAKILGGQ